MHLPSRARRILKWTGVVLSFMTVVIWIASLWCHFRLALTDNRGIEISRGALMAFDFNVPWYRLRPGPAVESHDRVGFGFVSPDAQWRKNLGISSIRASIIVLPLWLALLLTAIPTAWLWHRDRRLISCSPDHLFCSGCGYDLTRNTSGVCSECGLAKPPLATV